MKDKIVNKYYKKDNNLFYIEFERRDFFLNDTKTFETFDEFYKATNNNLSGADLYEYDFKDFDFEHINLKNAIIPLDIMKKVGLYNQKIKNLITKDKMYLQPTPSESKDLILNEKDYSLEITEENPKIAILYISDLHLNYKLIEKFTNDVNKGDLIYYFREILYKLKDSIPEGTYPNKILILGDVSFNFEIFKIFFTEYSNIIYSETFFILGNHEFWDKSLLKDCETVYDVQYKYCKFLKELGIKVLYNTIYIPNSPKIIYLYSEISKMSNEEMQNLMLKTNYAIAGGTGFAGLNENYNCDHGLYANFPITRDIERQESQKLEKLHRKLARIFPKDKTLVFASHMPKEDWTKDDYIPGWYYLNGHTHKNFYCNTDKCTVFADNQVGYRNKNFHFKYFLFEKFYDVFKYYSDGIHEITRTQYLDYYHSINKNISFTRPFYRLFLVKKSGYLAFVVEFAEGNLYLLNGGSFKKYKCNTPQYFYDNMDKYAESVKIFIKDYSEYQKQISNEVRKIGGNGDIHGCIIDITYNEHLYVNPLDGKITPYTAKKMNEKYVYKNIISLLKYNCPEIYLKMNDLIGNNEKTLVYLNEDIVESDNCVFVEDTRIYKISRIISGLQYTNRFNLIRIWNDDLIGEPNFEKGRLIVKNMIEIKA